MFNKITFFTLLALFILGGVTYAIKQKVIGLDDQLASVHREISQYEESLHMLTAEWAYLTRPERLQMLIENRGEMRHSKGVNLVKVEEVFTFNPHNPDPGQTEGSKIHLVGHPRR